jgi:glutamyl-tRNA reductase
MQFAETSAHLPAGKSRSSKGPPHYLVVGVNHKTLPVEQRENLARLAEKSGSLLSEVAKKFGLTECALLSTCNRFEIVTTGDDKDTPLRDFISIASSEEISPSSIYSYHGRDAVSHLFKVASSLDSLAIGEAQILGQVKDAYRASASAGLSGKYLHSLFQFAFRLAKKVRSDTKIAEHGVSVAYVAVKLALQIFGELSNNPVLVIGSGKMAELTVLHLKAHGCNDIIIANRTLERAADLAERVGGSAISLFEVPRALDKADLVVGSIQTDSTIIEVKDVKERRRRSPLFLIDLGVPRNFTTALDELDDVYLYNIDDLASIAEENKGLREEASRDAEVIIEYGIYQFEKWLKKLALEPELLSLRGKIRAICAEELQEALRGHLPKSTFEQVLQSLTHGISQKVSHEVHSIVGDVSGVEPGTEPGDVERLLPLVFDELLALK